MFSRYSAEFSGIASVTGGVGDAALVDAVQGAQRKRQIGQRKHQNKMKVTIKLLAGGLLPLDNLPADATVASVKSRIFESKGDAYAIGNQKLIHAGKILGDEVPVASLGLTEKDFLVCMATKVRFLMGVTIRGRKSLGLVLISECRCTTYLTLYSQRPCPQRHPPPPPPPFLLQ